MDSEKKALPSIYNISQSEQESQKPASKPHKKYVIGAVVAAMILLITLGAGLGALKLSNQFAKDTIKEYRLTANAIIKVDTENEITEIEDEKEGCSASNDFRKELTMLKVADDDSYVCYIYPLKRSVITPKALVSYMENHADAEGLISQDRNADLQRYISVNETIGDRRFLSQHIRKACEGYPIYWLNSAAEQTDNADDKKRNTRAAKPNSCSCCCCCNQMM
ncbi:unnamed protein product [Owenia fusiformis]|uniref:Uncharacterized protein n=1 Tax=Owenia fusiformis TaxID=6347 RepID=A0A8J1Y9Z9_OWEFU|nr:unnamed protein product [Owenia fusiformis]